MQIIGQNYVYLSVELMKTGFKCDIVMIFKVRISPMMASSTYNELHWKMSV